MKKKSVKLISVLLFFSFFTVSLSAQTSDTEFAPAEPSKEGVPDPKPASFGKAVFGMSLGIVPGICWYYYDNKNKRDQVLSSQKDLIERFTTFRDWRFDDNVYETNAVSHPLAGSLYFLSGRVNGFSEAQSFLFALGGSAFWEFIVEFKEIISINDMIHTPLGGFNIGEVFFQNMSFFAAGNFLPGWWGETLSSMTDTEKYKYRGAWSHTSSIWHNMTAYAGVLSDDKGTGAVKLGLDTEFFGINGLKKYGKIRGWNFSSPYSRLLLSGAVNSDGVNEVLFFTETSLLSFAYQKMSTAENGLRGFSVLAGINTAFDYGNRVYDKFHDKLGIIHLIGNGLDLSFAKNDLQLRLKNSIFFDFAQVTSLGLKKYYALGHTKEDVFKKGSVTASREGYYYALGLTDRVMASADWKNFQLGGEFIYSSFSSINTDGRTNREKKTGCNFKIKDSRFLWKGWLMYRTGDHTAVKADGEYSYLKGSSDGSFCSTDGTKFSLSYIFRL